MTSKNYHTIISDHVFRGKTSGKSNDIARIIYGAKFFNNETSLKVLIRIAANDIDPRGLDAIVPINTRDSHFNIPFRIAEKAAKKLNLKCIDALYKENTQARGIRGLNVILLDDVIYTGTTMRKAVKACKKAGAKSVRFFAICHSKSFTP